MGACHPTQGSPHRERPVHARGRRSIGEMDRGFTRSEVLDVVIIGIRAGIAIPIPIPVFRVQRTTAVDAPRTTDLTNPATAIGSRSTNNRIPGRPDGVQVGDRRRPGHGHAVRGTAPWPTPSTMSWAV